MPISAYKSTLFIPDPDENVSGYREVRASQILPFLTQKICYFQKALSRCI